MIAELRRFGDIVASTKLRKTEALVNTRISQPSICVLFGGAQSHPLRVSEDASYLTKFQNNPQTHPCLANEMLVDGIEHLLPAFDGGDDSHLEIDDGRKDATLETPL